jgi:hypothetical protein
MMCSDQPDRQSVQTHRLVLLVVQVLAEGETVLVVSGLLVKKVMTPHGSVMLNEEGEMVLSSSVLAVTWCFWGLFSWLGWAGGIGTCLGTFGLCQFASLLLQQPRFHE